MNLQFRRLAVCTLVAVAMLALQGTRSIAAQPVVPGTGTWISYVGDDFEDSSWSFIHQFPKSSRENDEQLRSPTGRSVNGRWKEGPERGQPDQLQVVPTPAGGLDGSQYALMMRTLNSGVPGRRSFGVEQDDLIVDCLGRLRSSIPVSEIPSCVVRVYLPPADEWEDRSGPQFGFRTSASTVATERVSSRFFGSRSEINVEPYWPGMWIHFRSKTNRKVEKDSAFLTVRGNRRGQDFRALDIPEEKFGWWTMGMSYTADGMVHYYAKPGVEDLTAADYITSQFPYNYRAQRFRTFFFDVCNKDDGRSWSTPFVIDDPRLYLVNATRVAGIVKRQKQSEERRELAKRKKKLGKKSASTSKRPNVAQALDGLAKPAR